LSVDDGVEDCADGSDEDDDDGFWSNSDSEQARIDFSNEKFYAIGGIIVIGIFIFVGIYSYATHIYSEDYKNRYQLEIDKKIAKIDHIRAFFEEQHGILQHKLQEKSQILSEYEYVETLFLEKSQISSDKEKIGFKIADTAEEISEILELGKMKLESIIDMLPEEYQQMDSS